MFESVSVIGHGRVGSAVSARLVERGLCVDADAASRSGTLHIARSFALARRDNNTHVTMAR